LKRKHYKKKVAEILKKKKQKKKESGCLIFEHKIEEVRGVFFSKKIMDQIPLFGFSSEF